MEFLAWWVLQSEVFAQKSTVVNWNCSILWIDIVWGLQKLGLESKVVQKLSLPKLIFFDEIFFWKNSVDFWHRKLTLKVQFWHFLRPWRCVNLQNTAISLEYSWFLSKNLAFYDPSSKKLHDVTDISVQCTAVKIALLPKQHINWFEPVQQNRQQALTSYSPIIYTVPWSNLKSCQV